MTKIVNICDVCSEIFAGGDAPKNNMSIKKTKEYMIPIYSNGEANDGLYGFTNFARVTEPSITVSARGTIGYTSVRNTPFVPIVRLITLTPKRDLIDIKYLFYAIQNYNFGGSGTSIPQLTVPTLKKYSFPLPNKDIQQKVVCVLDEVNKLIHLRKQQFAKLDELVKARFVELFGDPNLNDKGWEKGVINDIGTCVAGATPSTQVKEYWEKGTIPWMSSGEVNKGRIFETDTKITQLGYDNASTKLVPPKTVVLAMAGQGRTRGTAAITEIELCTNQSICSIVNNEKIHAEYLLCFLKLQYMELRGASTNTDGRGGLNLKIIGNYPIMIPPIELQNEFADFVKQIDKSKLSIQQSLEKLETLKKSLMQQYFG